jgi:signal transduction histidine kinase
MDFGRPWLRLVGVLLVAALPPLVLLAIAWTTAEKWVLEMGAGTALLVGAAITVAWAGIVAVVAGRLMTDEARSMVRLAQRGLSGDRPSNQPPTDDGLSAAQRRLAITLDERNRQISELAAQVRTAPIAEDAGAVARSLVTAARSMTDDPTWVLAVLRVADARALPPGVYVPDAVAPAPVEEVHGWASTLEADEEAVHGARHAIGPWGAFVVVDVAAGSELRAILLAPWEGRPPPSPAELDLFGLLGQHAATAIEHALLYTRLRDQTDELNRMAAIQTDFLRGVTHDLQTPLTSISAVASELRQAAGLDEAARTDLDTIGHQADRLRRMVGQLLTVSRLEAGALTPRQEVFRAEPVVRRTWDALRADRRLELLDDGPPHLLVGDPDRLEQILWAVLDNAVKYSPPASTIHIRLSAHAEPGGDRLSGEIAIRDEGAGMEADTLANSFDQFYRSDDARRLSPDGSGVGLYAARGLMRAMGGAIAAESRLGAGTTIRLTLPAERAEEAADDAAEDPGSGVARVSAPHDR